MKKLTLLVSLSILNFQLSIGSVLADIPQGGGGAGVPAFNTGNTIDIGDKIKDFFGFTCILNFAFRIVDAAIILSGILCLLYFIRGGLEWLTSSGDKAKVESARSQITNAIIGVAIIAASYALWKVVLTFFGIDAPYICGQDPLFSYP